MYTLAEKIRPLGIIILTVLAGILGLLAVFASAGMFLITFLLAHWQGPMPMHMPAALPAFVLTLLGVFYMAVAVAYFVAAYGYWTGRGWAWTLGLSLAVLGIVLGIISLPIGILDVIVGAVMIYLLTRPAVKEYLRRAPPTPTL